jgi:hypothetical protein
MLDYLYTKDIHDPNSWQYGGTIIDVNNFPAIVNTHGSIEKFGDDYYLRYHTPMGISGGARWTRIERVNIDSQTGLISPVELTSSGVRPAFDLGERIQFSSVVDFSNGRWASTPFAAKSPANDTAHQQFTMNQNNQYAGFRYVDFGTKGATYATVNLRTSAATARIRLVAGKPGTDDAVTLAEVALPNTSGQWREISVPIANNVTGVKPVYVVMLAATAVVFDWIYISGDGAHFSLGADGKTTTATIYNNESTEKTFNLIVAAYDEGGRLIEIRQADAVVPANTIIVDSTALTLQNDSDAKRIRAFLWDADYVPYAKSAEWRL